MEKQLINDNVSEEDLQECLKSLLEVEIYLKDECKVIMEFEKAQKYLSKLSHYIFSIVNRSISLTRGFVTLANSHNYLCAISLIRLQVDTCMRLYAMTIVDSVPEIYDAILRGEKIRNIKDSNGKLMTDAYLANEVDKIFPGFKDLYENTCGFIHFSDKHLFANSNIGDLENDSFTLRVSIGDIDDNYSIAEKVDYTFNMFISSKEIYKLVKGYRISLQSSTK